MKNCDTVCFDHVRHQSVTPFSKLFIASSFFGATRVVWNSILKILSYICNIMEVQFFLENNALKGFII